MSTRSGPGSRRRARPRTIAYPAELPITERRQELLEVIAANQVVVVAGETGSGKSTQLPKLCLELGRGIDGMIAHTQPRRIAARSIAERVAEELGGEVGGTVGFAVRFTDRVGPGTQVKVMTDGLLLAEIQRDPKLSRYDTVIVDEAHERSLTIDFLLGYLRRLLPRRPDLKVIITSATIDTARFAAHFDDAPIVEVSGRTYPVEVRYRPFDRGDEAEPRDQVEAIADAVTELAGEAEGDILVFCSGEREIRDTAEAVEGLELAHTEVVQLYSRLSAAEQHRVFQPHTGRRIVISTNVAETSLTVPGIRSVIDPGTARISRYSRRTKVQRLPIEPISKASANQRAGRCGRLGPGVCLRLYSEDDFEARPDFTEPEIRRTNLASVILQMAALGLGDVESFPFLDPPDVRTIRDGIALLEELGAVDPDREGQRGWLTETGRKLARLPVDPRLGRMLVEADRNGSLREVSTIVAALSIRDPRERPAGEEQQASQLHARFRVEGSDLLGWLALWEFLKQQRKARSSNQFRRMCREEYLNHRRIREWQDVRGQLRDITDDLGMTPASRPATTDSIHQALLTGLLSQVGVKDPDGYDYRGARGARFAISPGSSLFKAAPPWVMAAELVETTRLWAHQVAAVDPGLVEQAADHIVRRSYSDPWWDAERGTAVASETVTLYGLPLATGRRVIYGRIDPSGARELFIRHCLVQDEWESHHEFVAENRDRIEEVLEMEARKRSADLLAGEERLFDFFDARIPADITSVRHFDRWWRDARSDDPGLLTLTADALLDEGAVVPDPEDFPLVWHHGDLSLPISYEFSPGSDVDGVTIDVSLAVLDRLDPAVFEWQVPGMRTELIGELIRSLPKRIRKQLIPIADTARSVEERIKPGDDRLIEALRSELSRLTGEPILPDDFDLSRVPDHLRPTFRVVGAEGEVMGEGDDLPALRESLRGDLRQAVATVTHPLERSEVTSWDFGELPREVTVRGEGDAIVAYPALVDVDRSVAIRLLATESDQATAMWAGTRRLLTLQLDAPQRAIRPLITNEGSLAVSASPYPTMDAWLEDCLEAAVGAVMAEHGAPVWSPDDFRRLLDHVRDEVDERLLAAATTSLEVLDSYRTLAVALDDVPDVFEDSALDMAQQVNRLVYPGFVTAVGSHLADVSRYMGGIEYRLDRLSENPGRDRDRMGRVRTLEERHDHLLEILPWAPELLDIAWQLQELRMALFAQSLGVHGSVSEKRIRQALADATR